MSDQYPVIDPKDLIEDNTEKLDKYRKIKKTLEEYSGFPISNYDDVDGARNKCGEILDEIVQILLSYPFDEGKNKSKFKEEIEGLIRENFDLNQPSELHKLGNHKIYWNHFLIYLSNKLEEIKKI